MIATLVDWQDEEQYQRRAITRAARTLGIGTGGSPEYDRGVCDQVVQWLAQADLLDGDDKVNGLDNVRRLENIP